MGKILQNRSNAFKCAQVQIFEVSNNGRCRYLVFPTDSRSVGCCSTFTATHPERQKLGSMKTLETLKVSAEGNLPLRTVRHEYLEVMLMCRFTVCLKVNSPTTRCRYNSLELAAELYQAGPTLHFL
ncbi:hypothetical protein RRG08_011286 [Elysia crispata]|uniref:Uncharacterized protein n=1 Tax=Elysia crispata TaxID=231223 RepID=A0AAE1DIT6_9GAST|nr:hypothetical protein RRG08_011286 [Elysia crispata]